MIQLRPIAFWSFVVLCACAQAIVAPAPGLASTIATTDPSQIAAFRAGRTTLTFDELTVPPGPCFVLFDPQQYAALGIRISAKPDGSTQTHLAQLPACGHFGTALTLPNIIGGGTGPGSLAWRETVRFDFPSPADAIGANSDASGSNTTLTAYRADGSVLASVTGNQGEFMGIAEPGISYAVWSWNFDQGVAGFSLDNVTFSVPSLGANRSPGMTTLDVGPNPFRASTWVRWSARVPGRVRVEVFGVGGQHVATLLDETRAAGDGAIQWRATDAHGQRVAAGLYFVRVELAGQAISRRVVSVR